MNLRGSVAVAALGAVTAFAACSDDDDGSSSSSTDAPAPDVSPADIPPEPSAGCEGASAVQPGEEQVTTTSGGVERTYYRHVPPDYDGTEPTPVVYDFHGYLEGSTIHVIHSALGPFGDEHGFITISPQGSGTEVPLWDVAFDSPDMAYVGDLLDEVDETLCVDDRRVYATGLSNGAFVTSSIACVYADRIAAVAPVAGIRDIEGCEPARPVPVVAFHGTEDTYVGYDGGYGEGAANLPNPDGSRRSAEQVEELESSDVQGPSVPETTADWAVRNGCDPEPAEERVASDVVLMTFDCPPDATVELYTVEGGGHSWPGSDFSVAIEGAVGATTLSIDANEVMWEFFEQHPMPES
jgi:polyhydroxybutyrate depolymerase